MSLWSILIDLTGSTLLSCLLVMAVIILILFVVKAPTYLMIAILFLSSWGLVAFGLPIPVALMITVLAGVLYYFVFKKLID